MLSHSLKSDRIVRVALIMGVFLIVAIVCDSIGRAQEAAKSAAAPPDFSKLSDPDVAAALKLTDDQKAKIAALMQERVAALAAAAEPDRAKITQESDQKLSELLTDEQRQGLAAYRPEPKLQFNFRFQKWAEVLDWVASEAELSLVLDAPPPGTFNYSSTKEFSLTDAIDEINSVLLTKDYTLIRRDKMLMVIDMKEGLPENLIPRVKVDELDKRGRHEFVSVMFPLGKRPVKEVDEEIKPLLGSRGNSVSLPKTQQLLVTATAGNMRTVKVVIDSIPEPAPPKQPPKPTPPEKPEFRVHDPQAADPDAAIAILRQLVGGVNFVKDPKTNQINVYATPSQHKAADDLLAKMQTDSPSDQKPRLELYPLGGRDSSQLQETLRLVAPEAQLRIDSSKNQLVAWCTPADHQKLAAAIEKLEGGGPSDKIRQIEVYPLTKAEPEPTRQLLENLLPNAKFSIDRQTHSLIVIGVPADQRAVKATLDQLQSDQPNAATEELRFYPFKVPVPGELITTLQRLTPRSQITQSIDRRRLNVVATATDHATIKSTIALYPLVTPVEEPSSLEVYRVTSSQRKRFQVVLSKIQAKLPGVSIVEDGKPGELAIWAKTKYHAVIKGILDRLKEDVPEGVDYTFAAYPVKGDIGQTQNLLQTMLPDVRFVSDVPGKRILAWAGADEHAILKEALAKLEAPPAEDRQSRFETYGVTGADASQILPVLKTLVPNMRLSVDPKTSKLIGWGTPDEHAQVLGALEALGHGTPLTTQQVEVFPLVKADPQATLSLLQGLFPNAKLSLDSQTKSLISVAVPEQQQAIRTTIEQLQPQADSPHKPRLRFVPLDRAAGNLITILQELVPSAQITFDAEDKRLSVISSQEDFEIVVETVERVILTSKPDEKNRLEIYPVTTAQRTRFEAIVSSLESELPGIRVIKDAEPGELAIWAKPSQHLVLKEMVGKLQREVPMDEKFVFTAYQIKVADAANTLTVMQTLFPETRFVLDSKTKRLLVWARPELQARIREALEKIDQGDSAEVLESFRVYPVSDSDPNLLIGLLNNLLPGVDLRYDSTARGIIAWARQSDHTIIATTIKQIRGKLDQSRPQELAVYELEGVDINTVQQLLDPKLKRDAQIVPSPDNQRLIVLAEKEQQAGLKVAIEKIKSSLPKDEVPVSERYRLKFVDPGTMISVLRPMAPSAPMVQDSRERTLVVTATPLEHAKMREAIARIDVEQEQDETSAYLKSYQVKISDPGVAFGVVSHLMSGQPGMQLSYDSRNGAVVAFALPAQHEKIAATLADIEKDVEGAVPQVYKFRTAEPNAASTILRMVAPRAQIAVDNRNRSVVVHAHPADHEKIAATVAKMDAAENDDFGAVLKAYPIQTAEPGNLLSMLQTTFALQPDVRVSADYKNDTIVAFATPEQHEQIAKFISEVDKQGRVRKPVVYHLLRIDPNSAAGIVRAMTPKAQVAVDMRTRSVVATATELEHETIRETIEAMNKVPDDQGAPNLKIYALSSANGPSLASMLNSLYAPVGAQITWDSTNNAIMVMALPDQQEKIERIITESNSVVDQAAPRVYRFRTADPNSVVGIMQTIAPRAQIAVDNRNRSLIVHATPADHEKIAATVKQMDTEENSDNGAILKAYPVQTAEPGNLLNMLQANFALQPDIRLSADYKNETIVAFATPAQQKRIAEFIEEVDLKGKVRSPKVYRFREADPRTANNVLQTLVPKARMAVDQESRSIVVTATESEHAAIQATVDAMNQAGSEEHALSLKAYPLKSDQQGNLISLLRSMFGQQDVQFSWDNQNKSVVAMAPQVVQERIGKAIEELSLQQAADPDAELRIYELKSVTPDAALEVVENLVQNDGRNIKLTVNRSTRQLLAIAPPEQQERIRETLESLLGEKRRLEVFQLESLEPFSAELSIDRLFQDEYQDPPVIDSNRETQQLFVRGTDDQISQIRELLVKMGERGLITGPQGSGRRMRVIPFRGNTDAAIREIQRIWPKLRGNSIRVVTPSAVIPSLRKPGKTEQPVKSPKSGGQFAVPAEEVPEEGDEQREAETEETFSEKESSSEKNGEENSSPEPETAKPLPPIIIAPGDGSITIASDDPEALDQFESLLRAMSSQRLGGRGRDFVVFALKNTSATRISQELREVFGEGRGRRRSSFSSQALIVPDERLNSIIVHGSRNDRETIENLLEILDSPDVPDSLAAYRPRLIPVKHADADRVERVIRRIYQTALSKGGGGEQIPVPSGVSLEVAATIQRANAAMRSPLLTIDIDDRSNSLVVMAPTSLVEEIEELVAELDQAAAGESSRRMRVIRLQKLNTESLQRSLRFLQSDGRRRNRN